MKKSILFLTLASLCLVACNHNKNTEHYIVTEPDGAPVTPTWQVNYAANEARPDWGDPDPSRYENWTILLIQLEDALIPTVSENDMMAVFVGDELRGLSAPAVTVSNNDSGSTSNNDSGLFIIKAYVNEADNNQISITLRYYSATLRQLFTCTVQVQLELGKIYGMDEQLVPPFTLGAESYPVMMNLFVNYLPLENSDVKPAVGDILAAFVEDECRGTYVIDAALWFSPIGITVFARKSGETVTVKYYHASTGRTFTFVPTATTIDGEQSLTVRM